jgi:hypothetical protein
MVENGVPEVAGAASIQARQIEADSKWLILIRDRRQLGGRPITIWRSQFGPFLDGLVAGQCSARFGDEVVIDAKNYGYGQLITCQPAFREFVAAVRHGELDHFREPSAEAVKRDELRRERALSA